MKRSTILLLLGVVFLSFGYTTDNGGAPSKIYLIDNTLIRTTPGEDIRFYNIANPASVREMGRIEIEGNSDVAASGHFMYADRNYDLLVYDISNPSAPRLVDSVRKVFSYLNYYGGWEEGGIVGTDNVVGGASGCGSLGCSDDQPVDNGNVRFTGTRASSNGVAVDAMSTGGVGQAGSLARFMVLGPYLYCIDQNQIKIFDISNPARPRYLNMVPVMWGIETLFHDNGHLFIGGQEGMYIYSLSHPDEPERISEFTHRRSCDPVVVDGDRAYVTLRGGSPCGGYTNQMDIIDLRDIKNPTLLKTVEMDGPFGLAAHNGVVMVCDGASGVKTLGTANLNAITTCTSLSGITAHDIIWYDDLVIITAEEGFYLYDGSDPCHLKEYGKLF